jgi:hypothetical protein
LQSENIDHVRKVTQKPHTNFSKTIRKKPEPPASSTRKRYNLGTSPTTHPNHPWHTSSSGLPIRSIEHSTQKNHYIRSTIRIPNSLIPFRSVYFTLATRATNSLAMCIMKTYETRGRTVVEPPPRRGNYTSQPPAGVMRLPREWRRSGSYSDDGRVVEYRYVPNITQRPNVLGINVIIQAFHHPRD